MLVSADGWKMGGRIVTRRNGGDDVDGNPSSNWARNRNGEPISGKDWGKGSRWTQ